VPVLAWIINHYFYGGVHYSWLAGEFAPMLRNPKSSNPYLIYGDLYWAWVKRDRYDKYVNDTRRTHAAIAAKKQRSGQLDQVTAARLIRVCTSDKVVALCYPVIYRVDLQRIAEARRLMRNSALEGSQEVLVEDLQESEFDVLFADNVSDDLFVSVVLEEMANSGGKDPLEVLTLLEERTR
jgi:hypothetical protein